MLKFAANLTMMFNEVPFLDRFDAARDAGFNGVEFLFPYDFPAHDVGQRVRDNGLTQALFNLPPGDWKAGERGLGALPGREDEFKASVEKALTYAEVTGCKTLHAMAGIVVRIVHPQTPAVDFVPCRGVARDWSRRAGVRRGMQPTTAPNDTPSSRQDSCGLEEMDQCVCTGSLRFSRRRCLMPRLLPRCAHHTCRPQPRNRNGVARSVRG